MSVRPKQRALKLVAVVVLTAALFCMLSGAAVAQDLAEVPVEDIQSVNQYIDDLSTTSIALQAESEPVAGGAVTAKPGESPWLMDQQQFDPEATPLQSANEVEQISEANQPLTEGDLSTIAPVQEPLPPTAAKSATIEPVTEVPEVSSSTPEVPEVSSSTPEEPAASIASSTTSEPVASAPIDGTWRSTPPEGIYERRLLGLGIIVLCCCVLPGLIVLWKLSHARMSILDIDRVKSKQTHHIRAAEPKSSMLRAAKHTPRRRDHRIHKDL